MSWWKSLKLWLWYLTTIRPAICCTCKRIYDGDSFWNPWGPGESQHPKRRLACSRECAEAAVPGCTRGLP